MLAIYFLLFILVFILGSSVGSYINMLVFRLHKGKKTGFFSRSECDYCKHKLSFLDLIPIFSYLFLNGKCRYCGKKLSSQYSFVELASGIVFDFSRSVAI
ncbi:MAG TPA: prepilin peptidase [bacterium]|nr:prepilin peptidase [bacterium]